MANLIKIGNVFLNVDRINSVEDKFPSDSKDTVVVHFGGGDGGTDSLLFSGREADDLRTWLNSAAVNLNQGDDQSVSGG